MLLRKKPVNLDANNSKESGAAVKIKRLETFCTQYVGFVRVTVDDGSQGWGQVSTYNADITFEIFHRQVAKWSLGADALDINALVTLIPEREHKFPGSYLMRAITGLDTALLGCRSFFTVHPLSSVYKMKKERCDVVA